MLGVRREGVTEVTGKLQEAGLIHYSHGPLRYSIALNWKHMQASPRRSSSGSVIVYCPRTTPLATPACMAPVATALQVGEDPGHPELT